MERFSALRKALESERRLPSDYWGNNDPRCPHCGEVCRVSENEWWKLYEEGEHDVSCPHCDGDFAVSTRVSYSFSTDRQEGCAIDAEKTPRQAVQDAFAQALDKAIEDSATGKEKAP